MTSRGWNLLARGLIFLACAVSGIYALAQTEPQTVQPAVPLTVSPAGQPQAAESDASRTVQPLSTKPQDIQIGAGDLLEIRVFGVQDLTEEVRVSTSGDITVPLIGGLHIADLTQSQAEDLIQRKLRDGGFLIDPHVTVFTKEYATQGVSVLGEVTKPGVYPLLGARRLFDVLSMAGGLTTRAGKNVLIVHRDSPDKVTTVQTSPDPEKASAANVPIAPGDTISVSKAGIVYVVGDVSRPAGFVMESDKLTVLQAIALAGGTNGTASLDGAKVIRKTPSGVQELPMPLKKILSAKFEDVRLQADDVLFVPKSAAKSAMRRSAEAILQTATGLAIYHP